MDIESNLNFQIGDTVYVKPKYSVSMPNYEGVMDSWQKNVIRITYSQLDMSSTIWWKTTLN